MLAGGNEGWFQQLLEFDLVEAFDRSGDTREKRVVGAVLGYAREGTSNTESVIYAVQETADGTSHDAPLSTLFGVESYIWCRIVPLFPDAFSDSDMLRLMLPGLLNLTSLLRVPTAGAVRMGKLRHFGVDYLAIANHFDSEVMSRLPLDPCFAWSESTVALLTGGCFELFSLAVSPMQLDHNASNAT